MSTLSKDPEMIRQMFDSIAKHYDFLNTLMSLGLHRYWQRFAIAQTRLQSGQTAIDVCCGTGMLTRVLAEKVGSTGQITGIDLSSQMLQIAAQSTTGPSYGNIRLLQADAQSLPFPHATFDCAIVGYGLRNVQEPQRLLSEMQRVVKTGGRVVILEMSLPELPLLKQLHRFYLSHAIPVIGKLLARNESAYCYLQQSILEFYHREELTEMLLKVGLDAVNCYPLSCGVVTVHVGVVANP